MAMVFVLFEDVRRVGVRVRVGGFGFVKLVAGLSKEGCLLIDRLIATAFKEL